MEKNSLLIIKERVGIIFRGSKLSHDELETYTNQTKPVILDFLNNTGRIVLGVYDNVDISDCLMSQVV